MKDIFKKIIDAGALAPSGENCQPWKFVVNQESIKLYNLPERDQSLYNIDQFASCIAHGAVLENMSIAAAANGYKLNINLFPNQKEDPNLVAEISATPDTVSTSTLYDQISRRTTNRKPYMGTLLTTSQENTLIKVSENSGGVSFLFNADKNKMKDIGIAASSGERIVLENKELHNFFFQHINWTKEEDDIKKSGFYLETLELPEKDKKGFRVASKWNLIKVLNLVGISKKVAKKNAMLYSTGAGVGAITIKRLSPENFIMAGRILQRVWLNATKLDLNIHPMTGILFLKLRLDLDKNSRISQKHSKIISSSYQKICDSFGTKDRIVMLFRIGIAEQPTARASRRNDIVF